MTIITLQTITKNELDEIGLGVAGGEKKINKSKAIKIWMRSMLTVLVQYI